MKITHPKNNYIFQTLEKARATKSNKKKQVQKRKKCIGLTKLKAIAKAKYKLKMHFPSLKTNI